MGGSIDGRPPGGAPAARQQPATRHRPATEWLWDRLPSAEQTRATLRQIAAAGFGTVVLGPGPAFPREARVVGGYLHRIRAAVEFCGELGLEVGIRDDRDWLAGDGRGRATDGGDYVRARHLFWSSSTAAAPLVARISKIGTAGPGVSGRERERATARGEHGGDSRPLRWGDWELVAAVARAPLDVGDESGLGDWIDVSHWAMVVGSAGGCVTLIADGAPVPAGWLVTVFVSARCLTSRQLSQLDPRAARRLIEGSYRPYVRACADLVGRVLTHFRLASPSGDRHDWAERDGEISASLEWSADVRWIDSLSGAAAAHSAQVATGSFTRCPNGGDPLCELGGAAPVRLLLGAVYDCGEAGRLARTRLFAAYESLGSEPFWASLASFASASGVELRRDQPIAAGESLADLRMVALRGAVRGERQVTCPEFAAISCEPWFVHFPVVAAELAATTAFIAGAQRLRTVALVRPLHTNWSAGLGTQDVGQFERWARLLARAGVGFDVVEDRELLAAELVDDALAIGPHRYRVIVLAGAAVLPSPRVVEALEALVESGGMVVATGALPALTLTDGGDPELARRVATICASPPAALVPELVPVGLAPYAQRLSIEPGPGGSTIWQWLGSDLDGLRVVLLNDGSAEREVRLSADGDCEIFRVGSHGGQALPARQLKEARTEVVLTLAAEELICLQFLVRARAVQTLERGWTFCADGCEPRPIAVDSGWERQGFEHFCGTGSYRCQFDLPAGATRELRECSLVLPVVHGVAEVICNGVQLAVRTHPPFAFTLPLTALQERANELELKVTSSAANRRSAGCEPARELAASGLGATPMLSLVTSRGADLARRRSGRAPRPRSAMPHAAARIGTLP